MHKMQEVILKVPDAGSFTNKSRVKKGTLLVATAVRGIRELTRGKMYRAINGAEYGIFTDRPFVTVVNDEGENYSCHLSRFHILLDVEKQLFKDDNTF